MDVEFDNPQICLIIPPSGFLLNDRVFFPLGILQIAAVLRQSGINVSISDLSGGIEPDYEYYKQFTHCGITATSAQISYAIDIANKLKGKTRTILGGSHGTMVYSSEKNKSKRSRGMMDDLLKTFDAIIIGDGEKAIFEALKNPNKRIINSDNKKSEFYIKSLDQSPFPAIDMIDYNSYVYNINGNKAASIYSQIGCPFECGFCGGRKSCFYRTTRRKSISYTMKEIEYLYENYEYTGFMFQDEELNLNPDIEILMDNLIKYQKKIGKKFQMRGFVRSDFFTDKQAKIMKKAGFQEILVGFESGNNTILKNMKKRTTVEQNIKCSEIAKNNGIKVKALMSLGHPGETRETALSIRDFILKIKPNDFDIVIITPYPGSPYFDKSEKTECGWTYTAENGDKLHMEDINYGKTINYYKGIPGKYNCSVFTDFLSSSAIIELRDQMEDDIRNKLKIPYPKKQNFDHSMGQTGRIS